MIELVGLIGLLVLLILLRMPIVFALGVTSLIMMFIKDGFSMNFDLVGQKMFYGVNSFVLLAVPFFMLAGKLMNVSGVTTRLFDFADSLAGRLPGGLGHVNVVSGVIFSGMSGSASADAAALGAIELKAMTEKGFDEKFTVGITAASSTIGPIIPPSIPFIMYGVVGGVSISKLFLGGVIPGLLMGLALMVMVYILGVKRNYPRSERFSIKLVAASFVHAFFPLLLPVIILMGIFSGFFTPTEAAVIAVVYALLLGILVYREIQWRDIPKMLYETAKETAALTFIVASASLFGYLMVRMQIPAMIAKSILSLSSNPTVILLIIVFVFFLVGFFMETVAAIMIFTPLFLPVVTKLGIDPVHFGVLMVVTLAIGVITPPVGMVLFIMDKISKLSFDQICWAVAPFIIPIAIVDILIVFIPQLATYLPGIMSH